MELQIELLEKEVYQTCFEGLILPEVYEQLGREEVFFIGAIDGADPVGAVVWELEPEMGRLLSVAVAKDYQRQGVGTALLQKSMMVLRQLNCSGVYGVTLPGEEAVSGLLRSFGMREEPGDAAYFRIRLADAVNLPLLQGNSLHTVALKDLPDNIYYYYINRFFPQDTDLWSKERFDPDCSRFIVRDSDIVAGIFIEEGEEELSIAWLHFISEKPAELMLLFRDAAAEGRKKYPEDGMLGFTCYKPSLVKIAEKMFGDKLQEVRIRQWSLTGYEFRITGLR